MTEEMCVVVFKPSLDITHAVHRLRTPLGKVVFTGGRATVTESMAEAILSCGDVYALESDLIEPEVVAVDNPLKYGYHAMRKWLSDRGVKIPTGLKNKGLKKLIEAELEAE